MAEEVEFGDGEQALLQVEGQAVGGEDGEKGPTGVPSAAPWSYCTHSLHLKKKKHNLGPADVFFEVLEGLGRNFCSKSHEEELKKGQMAWQSPFRRRLPRQWEFYGRL